MHLWEEVRVSGRQGEREREKVAERGGGGRNRAKGERDMLALTNQFRLGVDWATLHVAVLLPQCH